MATGIPVAPGELVDVDTINSWARGYLRKTTAKAVSGTVSATDLLNGEFTLPAGAMGTDKIVRLTAWGDWKQNTSAPDKDIPTFQLFLGGTKLIDTNNTGTAVAAQLSARRGWRIVCEIQNLGASNSQRAWLDGKLFFFGTTTQFNVFSLGDGIVEADAQGVATYAGGASSGTDFTAVDTTAACALALKVVNANNGANYETKLYGALVEII